MKQQDSLFPLVAAGLVAWLVFGYVSPPAQPLPDGPNVDPVMPDQPNPKKPRKPCPGPGPCPLDPYDREAAPGKPVLGGKVSPDGKAEIVVDLPAREKKKNVGGRDGAGLCVFTSIEYCARWQNERKLFDFQQHMRQEDGGGYPEKVDQMIAKYAKGTQYLQDTNADGELLESILRTGRGAGVTYGGSDPHYSGYVAHMVTCVYYDRRTGWAAITDNNFPGDEEFVWMSIAEFNQRWKAQGGGWLVVLLNPPPPPVPHN